jgi:hypothetical protein
MALKIYNKMRENAKMVAAVAENGQFDRDLIYLKQVWYTPDYLFLLQSILS